MNEHEMLTLGEVAERLRMSSKTLLAWVADGRLRAVMVGRKYLVDRSEVDRILGRSEAKEGA